MANSLFKIILMVQVFVGLGVIGLVLVQQGKGADAGAAFGGGTSGSVFGATGSANFLSRVTAILATIFFVTCVALTYIASHESAKPAGSVMEGAAASSDSVMENEKVPGDDAVPAAHPVQENTDGQDAGQETEIPVPSAGNQAEMPAAEQSESSKAGAIPE